MISLVFAALLAGAPAAVPAANPPANPPAGAAETTVSTVKVEKPKPGPNETVCRKEAVLGSRMKSRVCMTQAEWETRQLQDRQDLNKAQTQQPLTF